MIVSRTTRLPLTRERLKIIMENRSRTGRFMPLKSCAMPRKRSQRRSCARLSIIVALLKIWHHCLKERCTSLWRVFLTKTINDLLWENSVSCRLPESDRPISGDTCRSTHSCWRKCWLVTLRQIVLSIKTKVNWTWPLFLSVDVSWNVGDISAVFYRDILRQRPLICFLTRVSCAEVWRTRLEMVLCRMQG